MGIETHRHWDTNEYSHIHGQGKTQGHAHKCKDRDMYSKEKTCLHTQMSAHEPRHTGIKAHTREPRQTRTQKQIHTWLTQTHTDIYEKGNRTKHIYTHTHMKRNIVRYTHGHMYKWHRHTWIKTKTYTVTCRHPHTNADIQRCMCTCRHTQKHTHTHSHTHTQRDRQTCTDTKTHKQANRHTHLDTARHTTTETKTHIEIFPQ
jgi:hypothetical protein